MTRDPELRNPFDFGRAARVSLFQSLGYVFRGTVNRYRPYIIAQFIMHQAVPGGTSKRRLEQPRTELRIDISEVFARPGVHLGHRRELVVEGSKPSTEDLLDGCRIGTGYAMVVKVGFRNFPDGLKILGL